MKKEIDIHDFMRHAYLTRRQLLKVGAVSGLALAGLNHTNWNSIAFAKQPKSGGTLRHIGPEQPMFDIHLTVSYKTQLVSSLVHRKLVKYAMGPNISPSDFTVLPDLAEKWDISPDGLVYNFHLRRGVKWENRPPVNGRELTSEDVKYTFDRVLKHSGYKHMLGEIARIEAPDKYTVKITHNQPYAPFLQMLAEVWTGILAKEVEDKYGDFKGAESLIGVGPFMLEKYEPGIKSTFVKNPDYYNKGLPYLDKIEWLYIKDKATQLSLFRAGKLDIPYYDSRIGRADVPSFRSSNPNYPIVHWPWLAVRTLCFRLDKPPFSDVRVRRAMSMSIDRKKWVDALLEGHGWTDPGPVPAPMKEWKLPTSELGPGAKYLEYNPKEARKLLAEAGYPKGFKTKVTQYPGYGPEYTEDLELTVRFLKEIGIDVQIINEEYGRYISGSYLGKFDEMSWGPCSLFTEVDSYLYGFYKSGHATNRSHVNDPKLDAMLVAQRRAIDKKERKKIIDDIQRHCAEQVYYIYTPYPKNVASWTPWVKDYAPKNCFDRGTQLEKVWIDK
jgi:peptide/nickel transport system substrate-binding protein